jgi:hypothetical protein
VVAFRILQIPFPDPTSRYFTLTDGFINEYARALDLYATAGNVAPAPNKSIGFVAEYFGSSASLLLEEEKVVVVVVASPTSSVSSSARLHPLLKLSKTKPPTPSSSSDDDFNNNFLPREGKGQE